MKTGIFRVKSYNKEHGFNQVEGHHGAGQKFYDTALGKVIDANDEWIEFIDAKRVVLEKGATEVPFEQFPLTMQRALAARYGMEVKEPEPLKPVDISEMMKKLPIPGAGKKAKA